jgi:PAS domain S-box-containing protein
VGPTGVERTFRDDEVIVSKTDLQGRITYANDVFLRVSNFAEQDVVGQPHNIIRHPSMPRCIFKLLWDTLTSGQELFAYVVNLASDGAHYWVLAHVTPTFGEDGRVIGYHSNRRTAHSSAIAKVTRLYADLLDEEARQGSTSEAVRAGELLLTQRLAQAGMSYDEFVWTLDETVGIRA